MRSTPWRATLAARECNVVGLNQFACGIMGIDWRHLHFMWDISTEISYARKKHPLAAAILPCLLCNHKVWVTSLRRYLLGKETLRAQGFHDIKTTLAEVSSADRPDVETHLASLQVDAQMTRKRSRVDVTRLTNEQLASLSGNTMGMPVIGSIIAAVGVHFQLAATTSPAMVAQHRALKLAERITVVGPQNDHGVGTPLNTLPGAERGT